MSSRVLADFFEIATPIGNRQNSICEILRYSTKVNTYGMVEKLRVKIVKAHFPDYQIHTLLDHHQLSFCEKIA